MALTDTRNQTWANDKSKFGYKMLEKMGWTEGKGLGVKEDGTTSHIRVRRKTTNAGIGGETNINAWGNPGKVAEGLSTVLSRLAPVSVENAAVKTEGVAKKGRGYYQRRSAGKNVSGYSENELREIFGGVNVEQKEATEKLAVSDGRNESDSEEEKSVVNLEMRSTDSVGETNDKRKSKCNPDEKVKRKRLRKEKSKKAKRKGLAVEPAIKKAKKGKKDKKRELR